MLSQSQRFIFYVNHVFFLPPFDLFAIVSNTRWIYTNNCRERLKLI